MTKDYEVVRVSLEEGAKIFEDKNRTVDFTAITDDIRVSTVFLGLDHNFSEVGAPILFETSVFGGDLDGEMWRYATHGEAWRGHQEAVRLVKSKLGLTN